MVINEDSHDSDFRVESNNVANMLFVDADNNRVGVGTGVPEAVMHVSGDFKATYYTPLNSTTQTSSANLNFWKLGRIYLIGERAAEIVLHGTKHGYGTGANIVGKTTILLRGGTSSTALDGIFYSEGQTSADSPPEVRYVNVGNDSFDIYVRYSAYSSIAHTVTTGGSWTPSLSNTGTGTAPTNSVAILPQRSLWLGSYEVLKQTQTETVFNVNRNLTDFRVASGANNHMLFVDASEDKVGIGTSSPTELLTVGNTSTQYTRMQFYAATNGASTIHFGDGTSGADNYRGYLNYAHDSNSMQFATGGSERMRIDSSGNLLVGTSSSSASSGEGVKFRIESNAKTISTTSNRSTSADEGITMWSTGANAWRFYVGWGGKINATSNTIQAISDQRFKENIRDLDDGLSKVMELRPRKFDWKEGKGADIKDDRGFIAQEFEEVFPDLVGVWKDEPPEGEEPYKAVSQDLIPTLVKAIQELSAKNDALEARIATLEG